MAIVPTTDVNLATEVRDVLNAAGGSVGNDLKSFFTTSAKINMWARYKPVRYAKDFCQDFDSSRADYDANWFRGTDYNCGIKISAITLDQLGTIQPQYILPTGGSSQPFRLSDFCKYKTDALGIKSRQTGDIYYNTGSSDFILTTPADDGYTVTFADLNIGKGEDELYFGVQIVSASGTKRLKTCDKTMANSGDYVNINIASDSTLLSAFKSAQTITVHPFVATVAQTTWASSFSQAVSIYPIAESYTAEIKYYTPKDIYTFSAVGGEMINVASAIISLTVKNISSTSQEFRWDLLKYESSNKAGYGKLNPTFTSIDGTTVSAGKSVTVAAGGSTTAVLRVTGSSSMVDTYEDTITLYWYDSEFGYRVAASVAIYYDGGLN